MIALTIDDDGAVRCIYSDELADYFAETDAKIARASSVEPGPDGKWIVDLTVSGGPVVGGFRLRDDALRYEVDWLKKNYL